MSDLAPEQRARQQIDAQLAASGWIVQDYKQFNPGAGRGIALREVPLKSGSLRTRILPGAEHGQAQP
jgi:type I site-specific restriction endonuclease